MLELAQAGRLAELCQLFAPHLQSRVSAEALRMAWDAEIPRVGGVSGV
jgi:hypothetical protein